ncbi:Transcriptional regulator LsrR, partial [human gut metagenome]
MIGRKGAVGDILGYFFDAKGDVVTDIKIHNELIAFQVEYHSPNTSGACIQRHQVVL